MTHEGFLCLLVFCISIFSFQGIVSATDDRIVGGRPANEGEIPYQVSLRRSYDDKHFCGGIVITPKHVLTAAHCMYYIWGGIRPPIVVSAVFGQLDLPITNSSVYRNASLIVVHPDFDRNTMKNDIAVIQINEQVPVDANPFISIISLRNISINSGNCYVSGWGVEEYGSEVISNTLQLAEVEIVDFGKCKKMYLPNVTLSDGMMCAGQYIGTTDACQGDSGGPLVCDGLLTGVVSTGSGCGSAEYPGIYADVSQYYDWIMNVTTSENVMGDVDWNFDDNQEPKALTNKAVITNGCKTWKSDVVLSMFMLMLMLVVAYVSG